MLNLREFTEEDKKEILDIFPQADYSIVKGIYYFDGWSDYEENAGLLIFQGIDDSIQYVEYGQCPYSTYNDIFNPEEITIEQAEELIKDMEEIIRE
jgi:hypothetical protein